jgi:hypothetical protein
MSRSSKILIAYQKRPADAGLGVVGVWVVSTGVLHMTETEMQKALRQNVRSCSITQKNRYGFLTIRLIDYIVSKSKLSKELRRCIFRQSIHLLNILVILLEEVSPTNYWAQGNWVVGPYPF